MRKTRPVNALKSRRTVDINAVLEKHLGKLHSQGAELKNSWDLTTRNLVKKADPRLGGNLKNAEMLGNEIRIMQQNVERQLGKKKGEEIAVIARDFFRDFCREQAKRLDASPVKSVYQIADEMDADYKKLLYTLRSIEFPMVKTSVGRKANLIEGRQLRLLELIADQIKILWSYEENYGKWVSVLKSALKISKSGVSKFMSRKIAGGHVPSCFFETVSPSSESVNVLLLKQRSFEFEEKQYQLVTRKGLKKQLKEFISEALIPALSRKGG